jgi:hypothetical protein
MALRAFQSCCAVYLDQKRPITCLQRPSCDRRYRNQGRESKYGRPKVSHIQELSRTGSFELSRINRRVNSSIHIEM